MEQNELLESTTSANDQSHANLTLMLASALVDHFDPMVFGLQLLDADRRMSALSILSLHCDEVKYGDAYHWSLMHDKRRELLKEHNNSTVFKSVLKKIKPEPDDLFGIYLQEGFAGGDLTKKKNNTTDPHALLRAARLIELVTAPDSTPVSSSRVIRQSIARTAAINELNNTTGGDLYGRYREFRELIRYRNTNFSDQNAEALKLFVIIGVGGIGKSSLISKYIAWQRGRTEQPPVVHFDFDRPILIPSDPLTLTIELTRQLGMLDPTIDKAMSSFRKKQRKYNQNLTSGEMSNRTNLNAFADLRLALADWSQRHSAVTLVIDTFEEVALRGKQAVEQTLEWLSTLRNIVQLDNLHIIISGREMPDSLLSDHGVHIWHRIRLSDLPLNAAQLLLTNSGVNQEIAHHAVNTFGGNPLVLRMFIRFCRDNPDEVDALLKDGLKQKRSAPTGKLALTFLFERILIRITNQDMKALTSPGLLLRHITVDLIQTVLAVPCGFGNLDRSQAQALFDKLAGHVWLVRQEGSRLLSHRRDLRRLMLPGIRLHYPDVFEEINQRAIDYYESKPSQVTDEDAWIEAAYHRGFMPDPPIYDDPHQARQIITQLGADLLDWPVHSTALIKHAAQLSERLTEDEIASLSQRQGLTSRSLRANQVLAERGAIAPNNIQLPPDQFLDDFIIDEAGDLENEPYEAIGKQQAQRNAASLRLAFHQGRFEYISENASRTLSHLFRRRDALISTHYWQDDSLLEKTPWLTALSVLAEPDSTNDYEPVIPVCALDAVQGTLRRVGIGATFELFYMLAVARLMNDRRAMDSLSSFLRSSLPCFAPVIQHLSQLQILQLSVCTINSGELIGQRDIITVETCDVLRWDTLSLATSEQHPATSHNRQRMDLVVQFSQSIAHKQPTIKELANYQSQLSQHKIDVIGPAGLDLLKSRQPPLYNAICFALESVSPDILQDVVAQLSTLSAYWPVELTPESSFTPPYKRLEQSQLYYLVETADRCSLLAALLTRVQQHTSDPLVTDQLRLLQRLDHLLTGSVESSSKGNVI